MLFGFLTMFLVWAMIHGNDAFIRRFPMKKWRGWDKKFKTPITPRKL
jgi:hypothetical protein